MDTDRDRGLGIKHGMNEEAEQKYEKRVMNGLQMHGVSKGTDLYFDLR